MGRILIADDEDQILSVMVDVLEAAGHMVAAVRNGEEALATLKATKYDVALLDVMMPKMDGYHLTAQIHSLPNPPKIIIVTSRDFDGDKNVLTRIGIDAFLPKPFSNQELVKVVQDLLKK